MPKCLKCGSYYIRAPCPVCSPLGVSELIVDSKEPKKKSIDGLQKELQEKLSILDTRKTELVNQINSMTTEVDTLEEQLQSHEVSKIRVNEQIKKLKLEIEQFEKEISNIEMKNSDLKQEKEATTQRISNLEELTNRLKTEFSALQQEKEEKEIQSTPTSQEGTANPTVERSIQKDKE